MTCTQFRALLADHLGNELIVEIREEFETHRIACEHCTYFLESYTHTVKITRRLPKSAPLPSGLEERLRAAVAKLLAEEPSGA